MSETVRTGSSMMWPFRGAGARVAGVGGLTLVVAAFTIFGSSFNLYIVNAALLACIGAISLNLLQGTAGQVSIGNAAFLCVGGFSSVFFVRAGIGFPWDVILAMLVAASAGLVVGIPALRLSGLALALATLAAVFIANFGGTYYQNHASDAGTSGFNIPPVFEGTQLDIQRRWSWLLLVVVVVVALGVDRLTAGKAGRAWRFIRDHEVVAPGLGIPVARYKLMTFIISSALIGAEGALLAHFNELVSSDTYTLALSVQYLAMVLVGGLDSIVGAVIGAALLTSLPTLLQQIMPPLVGSQNATINNSQYSLIAYGVLIVVFIISSPNGIVGFLRGQLWTKAWRRHRRSAELSATG
ncbi:branched-chain amino acid ABC transporter permease [Streptomyces sp. NPDC001982]|uniref:branched-chain amino acid ABC transporter permease n=1 Tax=Streptomyces sp. NPDC001982 TaxID=3154405 RepID=UPI00333124AF